MGPFCRVAAIDPCGKDSRHQDIRDTVIAITVELTCASERDATRETHADRGLYWLTKAYPRAKHGASGKRNFTRVSRVSRRRVIRYGGPPYGIHSYIENIQYDIHTPTTTRSSRGHGVREVRNGLRPDSRLLPDRRYRMLFVASDTVQTRSHRTAHASPDAGLRYRGVTTECVSALRRHRATRRSHALRRGEVRDA
jgi:hypothetical protein